MSNNRKQRKLYKKWETNRTRKLWKAFGIVFLCLIVLTGAVHLIVPDKTYSETEKRALASFPTANLRTAAGGEFMSRAEEYASDQFPLRDVWMRMKTNLMLLFGETESPGVYYCRDGSLIEPFEGYDKDKLKETANAVNSLAESGGFRQTVFLLIPTAVSLVPEQLPAYARTASEREMTENFAELLSDTVSVPDVLPVLQEMKEKGERVNYLTDHHWTTPAAYRVFQSLADGFGWKDAEYEAVTVSSRFQGSLVSKSGFTPKQLDQIIAYDRVDSELTTLVIHSGSGTSASGFYDFEALQSSNQYEFFLGGNEPLITVQTTADTEDTLLVFKDSYANCFLPFLAESYKIITIVDPRYYTDTLDALFLQNQYTDVLFLYNVQTLAADESLRIVLEDRGS